MFHLGCKVFKDTGFSMYRVFVRLCKGLGFVALAVKGFGG